MVIHGWLWVKVAAMFTTQSFPGPWFIPWGPPCSGTGTSKIEIRYIYWLVVDLPLWKMMEWKSVGIIIPNIYIYIWKNKKCSKPPTSLDNIPRAWSFQTESFQAARSEMKTTFNDVVSSKVLMGSKWERQCKGTAFRFQPASLSENFSQSPIVVAFPTDFVPNHHGFNSRISAAQQRKCVHQHQNR